VRLPFASIDVISSLFLCALSLLSGAGCSPPFLVPNLPLLPKSKSCILFTPVGSSASEGSCVRFKLVLIKSLLFTQSWLKASDPQDRIAFFQFSEFEVTVAEVDNEAMGPRSSASSSEFRVDENFFSLSRLALTVLLELLLLVRKGGQKFKEEKG
jgi:hypothetical protein